MNLQEIIDKYEARNKIRLKELEKIEEDRVKEIGKELLKRK